MGGAKTDRQTAPESTSGKLRLSPRCLGNGVCVTKWVCASTNILNGDGGLKVIVLSYDFRFLIIIFYGLKLLGPSWINKTEKAFFRGRDSREERLQLVQLSKENPQLLDAGITGYFFFQEKEKELGKAKLMGFFDFFKVGVFLWLCSDKLCPKSTKLGFKQVTSVYS